jgi:DNA-binding CsgD family transcriptional regulator
LSRADLEGVLAFLGDAVADEHSPAFLDHVVRRLHGLFPGTAICWSEGEHTERGPRVVDVRLSRDAWWDVETWWPLHHLDPFQRYGNRRSPRPEMYSDYVTSSQRRVDTYWNEVLRPAGIHDKLRVSLAAPRNRSREISFDSFDGEFTERARDVLTVLRPHLSRIWATARMRRSVDAAGNGLALTPRQREILGWVAQGKTNAQIAELLYLSPGTVRKHLDNVYATLGVHSRAAAVMLVFDGSQVPTD